MKNIFSILISVFLLAGCAPNIKYKKLTHQTFPPTESVSVLKQLPENNSYIELGTISIEYIDSRHKHPVEYLKNKARSIGANHIIIFENRSHGFVGFPIGTDFISQHKFLKALAIKNTTIMDSHASP